MFPTESTFPVIITTSVILFITISYGQATGNYYY